MVMKAKELCEDLIANVKEQYEEFKTRPRYQSHGSYGDQNRGSYGGGGGYGSGGGGGGYSGYGRQPSEGAAAAPGVSSPGNAAADYAAQYAQYYNGADPYAAYGGYAA